jgi:hypothetical protein
MYWYIYYVFYDMDICLYPQCRKEKTLLVTEADADSDVGEKENW